MGGSVYEALGAKAVINARGTYSLLGGTTFSPRVWAAMAEAAGTYADMDGLLAASGRVVAGLLGAEAALVTPGVAAALALASAVVVAEGDGAKLERLPDAAGMKADVLIQRRHRYRYDRVLRLSGARLVEVGDAGGTTAGQLAAALGPGTAAVCVPAHLDGAPGTVPLAEVVALAHGRGVPVLVDAAYLVFPLERLRGLARCGADLVCFSAKYLGGPNAGGFVCGRAAWVEAMARAGFTGFERGAHRVFGRPFKLDRHTVVGVVAALQEWLETDHEARLAGYARTVGAMERALAGVAGIEAAPCRYPAGEAGAGPANCLRVRVGPATGTSARAVAAALWAGNPAVALHVEGDALLAVAEALADGQEAVVAAKIREALASAGVRA